LIALRIAMPGTRANDRRKNFCAFFNFVSNFDKAAVKLALA